MKNTNIPVKILSLSDSDWRQGISQQPNSNIGGIFQIASNFDPFELMGSAKPTLTFASNYSSINHTVKWLTSAIISNTNYLYALCHRQTDGTALVQINPSNGSVTDYSSQIYQGYGTAQVAADILTVYKGRLIYGGSGDIRSNAITPAAASDKSVIASVGGTPTCFCVGADTALYVGTNIGTVAKITDPTTTGSPNSANAFSGFTSDFQIRDMINDGRYLAIVGDTNSGNFTSLEAGTAFTTTSNCRCQIQWWDYAKGVADVVWEFEDAYVTAMEYLDGNCYIFGYNNIWVCNISTPPRILARLNGNSTIVGRPIHAGSVVKSQGCIYWIDGTSGNFGRVWAYGNPIAGQPKVFFQPFITNNDVSAYGSCLYNIGTNFYAGTTLPAVTPVNGSTSRNQMTLQTTNITLDRPYKFAYAKVLLDSPLAANEFVTFTASSQNGSHTLLTGSINYNSSNPLQTLLFKRGDVSTSGFIGDFEDINVQIITGGTTTQPTIAKVEVYANPLDSQTQYI